MKATIVQFNSELTHMHDVFRDIEKESHANYHQFVSNMNLFKTFKLRWWEGGLFKVSLISMGIIIGSFLPDLFIAWRPLLLFFFVIPTIYITWVWWRQ